MKHCDSCRVDVVTGAGCCPLCGSPLEAADNPAVIPPANTYPNLSDRVAKYNFVLRLFVFLSLLGCGLSLLINLTVNPSFLWSLIVVAAVVYLWVTIPPLLRNGVNYAKRVVYMAIFSSALVVVLDLIVGYRGWSVSFVVPALLMTGLASIALLMIFSRTKWTQYVFYQILLGVFGFVPLVLYLTGLASNLTMVLLCASLSLACLLVTIIFGDRSVKDDFKRRFNI